MTRTIGIISAKGGVGKTSIAINLAAASLQLGKKALVVDADIKMSGLALQLGMFHLPITLNDVLSRKAKIIDALHVHPSGLRIIPASLNVQDVNTLSLGRILKDRSVEDNTIFIDAPPGLEKNAHNTLKACSECIIVTTPEVPSVIEAMKSLKLAVQAKSKPLGVVVNRVRSKDKNQLRCAEIESTMQLPVIATIAEHRSFQHSIHKQTPLLFLRPYSKPSIAFMKLAAQLLNEPYKKPRNLWLKKVLRRGQ